MFYESELQFLCDVFKKSHLQFCIIAPTDPIDEISNKSPELIFGNKNLIKDYNIHTLLGNIEPNTVYKSSDSFELSYIYFLLPQTASIFFLGPYANTAFTTRQILEICEKNKIPPKNNKLLEEFYSGIPVINENNSLLIILDTFFEKIWNTDSYTVIDVNNERLLPASPINTSDSSGNFNDILLSMESMEKRYNYENELMQAVSRGHMHKGIQLLSGISDKFFEKRTSDLLRNTKNYCIITNTLLRKAAENGGVHPIYLDRVSSSFASQIELLPSTNESSSLMYEMFRSYCRLVRMHSTKNYSPVVQKAIILIDSDLSANLSLSTLASDQNISSGYLSTIFKRETGKTVTEYIRDRRISHAVHLLSTTHLQIQTVALHCGIMDVQYFSKIFKKQTGKTPKEYRESVKLT